MTELYHLVGFVSGTDDAILSQDITYKYWYK